MRRRFFVESFRGGAAVLRGEAAHHVGHVLRAEPGQLYELSDGHVVWLGRVERVGRGAVEFSLLERIGVSESALRVVLLLSVVKFDRFEWCLEKATELGVAEVVPLASARSDKKLVSAANKRAGRWQKILFESAQQSRRLRPPILTPVSSPQTVFPNVGAGRVRGAVPLLLSERQEASALRSLLQGDWGNSAALAIGPEGGWTDEEISAALAAGFLEACLGPHILRTETAVVAGLAILNYVLGDSVKLI